MKTNSCRGTAPLPGAVHQCEQNAKADFDQKRLMQEGIRYTPVSGKRQLDGLSAIGWITAD